jgi:asparagine synthase (glutamine-hydrolysing)
MCGITGIRDLASGPIELSDLQAMCRAMVHRGPDDEGYYLGSGVGLAMRRLSIIDVAGGHQPIANEDRTVWAILNGEIYNYRELRADLESRGHTFSTASDTEVIVHLYEEHGARCVEKLRGMFGLAVWDERSHTLLIARDRLGIKPLYYAQVGSRLLWASELKSLLALPEVERTIDWPSLSYLLTFQYTPADQSIVSGVRKLEPGCLLIAKGSGTPRIERYWTPRFAPDHSRSMDDTVERLRELLEESVRMHLVSDVPLGAFLSGGLDSSSVVATMARLMDSPVETFSIGFDEPAFDERKYARQVASQLGTRHHELVVEPDAVRLIDDLTWHLDEPLGDASAIPTYFVSRLASQHVKVVLSGDGGDELFGGYDKYCVEQRERRRDPFTRPFARLLAAISAAMPEGAKGRRFIGHHALRGGERYIDAGTIFAVEAQRKLLHRDVTSGLRLADAGKRMAARLAGGSPHWLSSLQHLDLEHYLPLDVLTKVDRMSMACSIETRVPLLDHVLVEFVATIPGEHHLRAGTGKAVFKRAMRGVLPDEIIDRPKRGFGVPLAHWFRGDLSGFIRDVLLDQTCQQRGIFQPEYVRQLIAMNEGGRNLDMQLWTLVSFEMWCRLFLDGSTRRQPARVQAAPDPGRVQLGSMAQSPVAQ